MSNPKELSEDLTFEAALQELETIVSQLERGNVELDKSIEIYERGAALKQFCEGKLKAAQLRIDQIVLGDDGEVKTESAQFE